MKRNLLVLLAVALVICWASLAAANTYYAYTLSESNTGGFLGNASTPPPYGSVLVDLENSTTAKITFSTVLLYSASGGGLFSSAPNNTTVGSTTYPDYYSFFGAGQGATMIAANINATSFTSVFVSATDDTGLINAPFTFSINAPPGTVHMDSFGYLNLGWNGPSVGANEPSPPAPHGTKYDIDNFTFTVTNTGGTWGNAGQVLTKDAAGYFVSAHEAAELVINPDTGSPLTAAVGAVPLPPSALLLGSGLLGLVGLRRFRKG